MAMKHVLLAAAAALSLAAPSHAAETVVIPKEPWSFDGIFGKFDRLQLQRGLQVYKEVCASCHGLQYIAFRDLKALGYSDDQVKAFAAEYEFPDIDDEGSDTTRKGLPSDRFPNPYPNEKFARASNNGSLPPDLSLISKAREGGPDYLFHLITGYEDPPPGFELMEGLHYNKYFADGNFQIAMAKQINDDQVTYADGTKASTDQIARDITAFLHWAAEPKLEARHSAGFRVMLYTIIFTILAFFLKKRIWARLEKK
jgi:cytochrome c1